MNITRNGNVIESEGVKLGIIDINGSLRMAKGQTEHREAVEAFLAESGDKLPDELPEEPPAPLAKPESIPPCPTGSPDAGDKDPAVIRWWFTHHPAEAAKRYQGRRFAMPDLS